MLKQLNVRICLMLGRLWSGYVTSVSLRISMLERLPVLREFCTTLVVHIELEMSMMATLLQTGWSRSVKEV